MATNTLKARVAHASKTEAEWKSADPVLLKGEIAYSSDKRQIKIGDGTTKWSALTYNSAIPTSHSHDLSAMINTLSTGSSTPTDADYYVSQYAGGGTTTTTYHRRPMSALWAYIKSKLAAVATSGSYNDLSNKPTIGNATITIKQAGTTKGTFTTNQTSAATIELTDNNTTYSTGTASYSGTTKLYTGTGAATDGTMTQAAIKSNLDGKLSLTGGTMSGTATIAWADSGNWGNSNSGVTFPVKRGGLKWNGQSDWVELFAVETANDNLDLALQFGDDNSNGLSIRNSGGTEVARIKADGSFTGTTLWDKISGKPSTYTPSSHTHDDRYYTETEINTKLAEKLSLTGGTMSGNIYFSNSGTTTREVRFTVGDNDYGRVAAGATASNAGWVELATADDGNEPVYVRQYTGVFSSITRTATLLDGSGNTSFPNMVSASKFRVGGGVTLSYDSTNKCLNFTF